MQICLMKISQIDCILNDVDGEPEVRSYRVNVGLTVNKNLLRVLNYLPFLGFNLLRLILLVLINYILKKSVKVIFSNILNWPHSIYLKFITFGRLDQLFGRLEQIIIRDSLGKTEGFKKILVFINISLLGNGNVLPS